MQRTAEGSFRGSSGKNRSGFRNTIVRSDFTVALESSLRRSEQQRAIEAQHGPCKVLVENGVALKTPKIISPVRKGGA